MILNRVTGASAPVFVERPRVSAVGAGQELCVTGASAPVFVERSFQRRAVPAPIECVTGASAPVFVERGIGGAVPHW